MNTILKQAKQDIRAFLRTPVWTEEKLCALLAHAQDKLSMWSCCCLIGVANAPHALMGINDRAGAHWEHYHDAQFLPLAQIAEEAFVLVSYREKILTFLLWTMATSCAAAASGLSFGPNSAADRASQERNCE